MENCPSLIVNDSGNYFHWSQFPLAYKPKPFLLVLKSEFYEFWCLYAWGPWLSSSTGNPVPVAWIGRLQEGLPRPHNCPNKAFGQVEWTASLFGPLDSMSPICTPLQGCSCRLGPLCLRQGLMGVWYTEKAEFPFQFTPKGIEYSPNTICPTHQVNTG